MASTLTFALIFFTTLLSCAAVSRPQPLLSAAEQDNLYHVLESINSDISWRSLFPGDICSSAPHGVVCDYFDDPAAAANDSSARPETVHVTELSLGYVSDYTPNPPCSPNSTLSPRLFTSFKYLRKLFFYKCFTETRVSVPDIPASFGESLEELVFIENPALVGPLRGLLGNFTSLRRVVLTGNGVYGKIPDGLGDLANLEEITLSRNQLTGGVPVNMANLKKLKVLDLSHNFFDGNVPDSMGQLKELLKLDLNSNGFSGKIPESLKNLQGLEFLDMSFNRFGNYGVPSFLGKMPRLREVYLSGNLLGGQIPDIWENLGNILGIGFSKMGLVGNIPASMGVHLRNLCYLGLDNNNLGGILPRELELLEYINEINLENNNLSGRVPFSAKFSSKIGYKLKLGGNPQLCVDDSLGFVKNRSHLGQMKRCSKPDIPNPVVINGVSSVKFDSYFLTFIGFLFVFA